MTGDHHDPGMEPYECKFTLSDILGGKDHITVSVRPSCNATITVLLHRRRSNDERRTRPAVLLVKSFT